MNRFAPIRNPPLDFSCLECFLTHNTLVYLFLITHTLFPRVCPWPSSLEQRLTWSAQPSRQRKAYTVFFGPPLWPAWTNSSLPINPALSAAYLRDSSTCPIRQTSSPLPWARTSPRAAPSCECCRNNATAWKKRTTELTCIWFSKGRGQRGFNLFHGLSPAHSAETEGETVSCWKYFWPIW